VPQKWWPFSEVSKSRPIGEKIFLSNLCDFIVSTAHCFYQNTQLMVTSFLLCLKYAQTTHSPELTFDITRAMWLAMWHPTGVCFITSFNRICHCQYFFVRLWNNWSKINYNLLKCFREWKSSMLTPKFPIFLFFNFCACALVSGIPQTHVTPKK